MASRVLGKELENGDGAVSLSVAYSHVKVDYQALGLHAKPHDAHRRLTGVRCSHWIQWLNCVTTLSCSMVPGISPNQPWIGSLFKGRTHIKPCPGKHLPCMLSHWLLAKPSWTERRGSSCALCNTTCLWYDHQYIYTVCHSHHIYVLRSAATVLL